MKAPAQLDPYLTQFLPVSVPELPESTLLVYLQLRFSQKWPSIHCKCHQRTVHLRSAGQSHGKTENIKKRYYCSLNNAASYEEVKVPPPISVNATQRIHNDLLPQNDQTSGKGTRTQCLRELIKQQSWGHLTPSKSAELEMLILENDPLFILNENELGLISGPPEHIRVSDPQPCRGSRYRYPEKAKQIIADMLKDMEERDRIIEQSTAAWLSPVVLVNKPDGSKRMCLDYRQVNKHLATDIYPLPRLEELVDQAEGHQYYVTRHARGLLPVDVG